MIVEALHHADGVHLAANLSALVILLTLILPRLRLWQAAAVFIVSIAAGQFAQHLANIWAGDIRDTVGISAGVFGLLGAYAAINPRARAFAATTVIVSAALAILAPLSYIAHAAHAAGVITGYGLGRGA